MGSFPSFPISTPPKLIRRAGHRIVEPLNPAPGPRDTFSAGSCRSTRHARGLTSVNVDPQPRNRRVRAWAVRERGRRRFAQTCSQGPRQSLRSTWAVGGPAPRNAADCRTSRFGHRSRLPHASGAEQEERARNARGRDCLRSCSPSDDCPAAHAKADDALRTLPNVSRQVAVASMHRTPGTDEIRARRPCKRAHFGFFMQLRLPSGIEAFGPLERWLDECRPHRTLSRCLREVLGKRITAIPVALSCWCCSNIRPSQGDVNSLQRAPAAAGWPPQAIYGGLRHSAWS